VAAWEETYRNALEIKRWLNHMRIERLHVESDHVDLQIIPEQDEGGWESQAQYPSFELFLSRTGGAQKDLLCGSAFLPQRNYVESVTLTFEKGKVVQSELQKGAFPGQAGGYGPGAAGREFSLTDKRFSK